MTYVAKPKLHHPTLPKNKLGFTRRDYEGKVSTLCAGCGHDSISAALIQAFWELDIQPHRVAKLSGIGCSSKTPDYFLGNSHGFNTVHGRMPSVLTGANLANRELIYIGVSGDGDSASIGLGQFAHVMRRGVNMTYILENNGVYGLTKGQFSATADKGSKAKKGATNQAVNRLGFWPSRESITAQYAEGDVIEVPAGAEGSINRLRKLATDYDPTDKVNAISHIARASEKGEVLTGLLYLSPESEDLHAHLNTYEAPFNKLGEKELCPGSVMLDKINAALR